MATECKVFQETPCFLSCPRVFIDSKGAGLEHQEKRLGCFRLSGTMLGILSHYQNSNGQFLAPDAVSTQLIVHWLISETYGAINGGIRNSQYEWVRCPFTGWDKGWQVDKGHGIWMDDETMTVTCLRGNEDIGTTTTSKPTTARPTTARPTTAKPTTARPTTAKPTTQPSLCHKEGPSVITDCTSEFNCCRWNNGWDVTKCHCNQDFVFSELVEHCTWSDVCFKETWSENLLKSLDHTCDDGNYCY
eukprot:TRINITY_DN16032_c0_g1_i1.p1 TRINITY_DN16032_c0_g1~~TRINITY_DN16032_c0_g1_i1.p1  ORF type:complete len:268 (-),score=46.78 TRINITY_DN16032_c0_g1_i1:57-794(-)